MEKFLSFFEAFNHVTVIVRLLAAVLIGGLIGSERGRHGRPAGLRTHILICIGAAMTSLTSMYLSECLGYGGDVARISAQVISGIGFLGAGTIIVRNKSVITGLTTAAGMWATAVIGIAVGYGFYAAAFTATAICIASVTLLSKLERKHKDTVNIYIELTDIAETEQVVECICSLQDAVTSYDIIPPKSGQSSHVGILCILHGRDQLDALRIKLCETHGIAMILSDIGVER